MLKQSSSRNQKAKGSSKLKVPFQICLLIAIAIWLVYRAKHLSDQTTALAEESSENEVVDQVFKLGRKNLNPRLGDLGGRGFQKHPEEEMEMEMETWVDEENEVREEDEDEIGVGNEEKSEEGDEHEQLEDLIDRDDSED